MDGDEIAVWCSADSQTKEAPTKEEEEPSSAGWRRMNQEGRPVPFAPSGGGKDLLCF